MEDKQGEQQLCVCEFVCVCVCVSLCVCVCVCVCMCEMGKEVGMDEQLA